jgi:hypothetical protein
MRLFPYTLLLLLSCLPIAQSQDKLTLYCTDISQSTWVASEIGNHTLIVPSDQPYFIHMNFNTKKAFIASPGDPKKPEAPNNPALGDVVVSKKELTQIKVSNALSLEKTHADAVTRLTITIDRRTGILVERAETLLSDNSVTGGTETVRICGTSQPKF